MNSVTGRQLFFWGTAFVLFAGVILLLGEVLLPFVLGLILAYFLEPAGHRTGKTGVSRELATGLIAVTVYLAWHPCLC